MFHLKVDKFTYTLKIRKTIAELKQKKGNSDKKLACSIRDLISRLSKYIKNLIVFQSSSEKVVFK